MYIGGDALTSIGDCLAKLDMRNPLIVTDPFMAQSGKIEALTDQLDEAGLHYRVFSDTVPEPTTDVIDAGVALLAQADFDGLIAFGGGSPIDTAKAINILAAGGGQMRDYKVPAQPNMPVMPLIAIPTTAGTGSEVTKVTVITDTTTDEKMLIMGLACLPSAAIVDYTLTFSVPMRTTADTGIDSITHAIEAYVSLKASPYTDTMALSAMSLLYKNIRTVCTEPDNAAAREQMMLGANQAGTAFSNASVCLVHGMSRPIGAAFHVPHGLSNAMLLPAVTRFSAPSALSRYATCARVMGIATEAEGDQIAVSKLVDGLADLNTDLNVPSPAVFGIDKQAYFDAIPLMAEQAIASGSPANNPRVPTETEIASLYEEIWT